MSQNLLGMDVDVSDVKKLTMVQYKSFLMTNTVPRSETTG